MLAACSGKATPAATPSPEAAASQTTTGDLSTPPPITPTAQPVPAELAAADAALREGRFEDAEDAYIRIANSDTSVWGQATLGAAIAAHNRGDPARTAIARALHVLYGPEPQPAIRIRGAYLAGRWLNDAERWTEAQGHLATAAETVSGPLLPYVQFELGRAAANAGDHAAAALAFDRVLSSLGLSDALAAAVYRARADEAKTAGDAAARSSWLARLVAVTRAPADRYELATVAATLGAAATYADQLRAIVVESPGSMYAPLAAAELRAGGYALDAGLEGLVYYRRGAYAEAKRVLTAALAESGLSAADLTFRAYYLAAAFEDSGDYAAALVRYDFAAAQGGGTPFTHRAKYWASRVTEALGDPGAASARYTALALEGPAGEFTAEAAFRAGYLLLAAGDAAGAVATWNRLGIAESAALLYWKGRAELALGDPTAARASFLGAVAADPLAFHALEAARALGQRPAVDVAYKERALAGPRWDAIESWLRTQLGGEPDALPELGVATELMAVGLEPEAAGAVEEDAEGARGWALYGYTRRSHELGLVHISAKFAVTLRVSLGVADWAVPAAFMRLTYPLSYGAVLDEAARAEGIDPLFLAALIRQESFWDPMAASRAGALGLSQVIPSTGEGIAAAVGLEPFAPGDLFRPAVAIQFGAHYLGGQLRRFGDPYAALAAYNAGPGAAIRWAVRADGLPAADFLEAIEFAETKGYVQSVMEHYAHYLVAYGP